ncbi:MmgE/PrpD family protein [Maritimibacter sp. HL-12]|uniref:MmgE/PrpD family protein n=1 Tax=Maritimibacter sp. HL-12 TaxID=1162418 RepID=UPI000A0EF6FC|nr:MmgE/PrpD family protein [Maritimibacter sp. HL-12]SMH38848.1 2-methylcitrate dehydratase PrpD [Maritimibacter sp. HL-12]
MNLTRDIAVRVGACGWNTLPSEARHAARLCLADGLAVMLGALRHEPVVVPFSAQARLYGPGQASLLAGGTAPVPAAALANGALAHALDFEDTFDQVGLHPNAAVIPTVLAIAEAEGKTLGDILPAMALGADLACRIGLSLTTDPGRRGWYHPPMIGAVGAALAGAKLLGLSPDQTVAALSLVQVQFALTDALKRSPASDLRAVRDGFAARAATEAVLLARAGVTGTADPLSEEGGLVHLLTCAAPDPAPFASFGKTFLTSELSLKLWPCCRGTHPAIALALALRREGIVPDDLEAVVFTVEPPDDMLFAPRADRIRPGSAITAKFSVPFCFARALLHGAPGLDAFSDTARRDVPTLALADKVELGACGDAMGRKARLVFKDGTTRDRTLPPPPELRAGTASYTDISPKLRDCLGPSQALDTLLSLETADPSLPVSALMTVLATARPN